MEYLVANNNEEIEKVIDLIIQEAFQRCAAMQNFIKKEKAYLNRVYITDESLDNFQNSDFSYYDDSITPIKTPDSAHELLSARKVGHAVGQDRSDSPLNTAIANDTNMTITTINNNNYLINISAHSKESDMQNKCVNGKDVVGLAPDVPFTLELNCGLNLKVPCVFLNCTKLLYAASHVVALYNIREDRATFLMGFKGEVSCLTKSDLYVAACDQGSDGGSIIVWDIKSFQPVHCWTAQVPCGGFKIMCLSPCSQNIFAVSFEPIPILIHWPLSTRPYAKLLPEGTPVHIQVDQSNSKLVVITYTRNLLLAQYSKKISDFIEIPPPKCSKNVGNYRASSFTGNTLATGTSKGYIVVNSKSGKYIKTVQIQKSGIICMEANAQQLIAACEDGKLWLYESDLRLRGLIRQLPILVTGISFPETSFTEFAFTSTYGTLGIVTKTSNPYNLRVPCANVSCHDCHSGTNNIVIGLSNGCIVLYNFHKKSIEKEQNLLCCKITVVKYSTTCLYIGVGSENGDLLLVDGVLLNLVTVLPSARAAICYVAFSECDSALMYVHRDCGVGLIKETARWHSRGKYRPHTQPITGMIWTENQLFTIGKDQMLAEYDTQFTLRLLGRYQIEQCATPVSIARYESCLMIANSEGKLRFLDINTKELLRTVRSPGDSPIHAMQVFEDKLMFAAGREMGCSQLPWRGWSPLMQAHPHKVTAITFRGNKVFTSGTNDTVLLMWSINPLHTSYQPRINDFQENLIKLISRKGPISKTQLIDYLRLLGYFPSNFDVKNILKEYAEKELTGETLKEILFNYGPPPGTKVKEVREALQSVSDVARGVVQTDELIQALTSAQAGEERMTETQAVKCLQVLCEPSHVPPSFSTDYFFSNILGIDISE